MCKKGFDSNVRLSRLSNLTTLIQLDSIAHRFFTPPSFVLLQSLFFGLFCRPNFLVPEET